MPESILICNAKIVSSENIVEQDVLIQEGKIKKIAGNIESKVQEIIDGSGLFLLPGIIDTHVHLREPGFERKEDMFTASKAAASGGVTSIFDMPNNNPPTVNPDSVINKKKIASEKCLVNYNFFPGITHDNIDELNNIPNIPGYKLFMGSSTGNLLVDDDKCLENILSKTKKIIVIHAEDNAIIKSNNNKYGHLNDISAHNKIRSPEAAESALKKACELALKYNKRIHILHITSSNEVNFLKSVKNMSNITCEVCPQHLFLNSPSVYKLKNFAKVNPPIRSRAHGKALWEALKNDVIDVISTDHAPHTREEKELTYRDAPSGMPGLETLLSLMLNSANKGKCSLNNIVKWMCENPATIFKIKNKGFIKENYDADLVLVDMNKLKVVENGQLYSRCNWSAFDGVKLKGCAVVTFVNGNIVYRNGEISDKIKGKEIIIL